MWPVYAAVAKNYKMLEKIYNALDRRVSETWGTTTELDRWNHEVFMRYIPLTNTATRWLKWLNGYCEMRARGESTEKARTVGIITRRKINLSSISQVSVDWGFIDGYGTAVEISYLEALDGSGNVVASVSESGRFSRRTTNLDVSSLSGDHDIRIRLHVNTTNTGIRGMLGVYDVLVDAVSQKLAVFYSEDNRIRINDGITEAITYSPVVTPPAWGRWDIVNYHILEKGGSYQVDVLNGENDDVLMADVPDGADISSLTAPSLMLRVTLDRPSAGSESPEFHFAALRWLE